MRISDWSADVCSADLSSAVFLGIRSCGGRYSLHRGIMTERASALARKRNAIKLHPVVDQPEAKLFGDLALKFCQIGIDKLDHLSRFDIHKMTLTRVLRGFQAGAPIPQYVTLQNYTLTA